MKRALRWAIRVSSVLSSWSRPAVSRRVHRPGRSWASHQPSMYASPRPSEPRANTRAYRRSSCTCRSIGALPSMWMPACTSNSLARSFRSSWHGIACRVACIRGVDVRLAHQLQQHLGLILLQQKLDLDRKVVGQFEELLLMQHAMPTKAGDRAKHRAAAETMLLCLLQQQGGGFRRKGGKSGQAAQKAGHHEQLQLRRHRLEVPEQADGDAHQQSAGEVGRERAQRQGGEERVEQDTQPPAAPTTDGASESDRNKSTDTHERFSIE